MGAVTAPPLGVVAMGGNGCAVGGTTWERQRLRRWGYNNTVCHTLPEYSIFLIWRTSWMITETVKEKASQRLKRIEGQIRGLQKMLDEKRYCMDILSQTRAVAAAIHGVEDLIMENHLATCVAEAMHGGSDEDKREKISEIMEFISRYRKKL